MCPKCDSSLLFVDADPEFKHLIVDVLADYGCEIASTITVILALTQPLYVEIRRDEKDKLTEEELKAILRKHKNHVKNGIDVLKSLFKPYDNFEKQLSSIFESLQ